MDNLDLVTIGDTAIDAFIRIKEASVHCGVNRDKCELCFAFASKVPYEFVSVVPAVGNAANVAVCASRLGLKTGIISNIGDDSNGKVCLQTLGNEGVNTSGIALQKDKETNYHFVLWFEDERTILTKHHDYDYAFLPFGTPRWVYVTSLGAHAVEYQNQLLTYLKENPGIKVAFQPGTYQIKSGAESLAGFYERSDIFFCNKDEAKRILNKDGEPETLIKGLRALGPKSVVMTDGPRGAYYADNKKILSMPIFPNPKPPLERTGAGDAFSGTFLSALILGKTPEEALRLAPVNSMSVVQEIGAQKGLLSMEKVEELLKSAPDSYIPKKLEK
jgi:ribokinase